MKDLITHMTAEAVIGPAALSADMTSASFDLLGFNAAMLLIAVGVGGITFDATNKIDFVLTHSDDGTTFTDVIDKDVLGVSGVSDGIIHSLLAAHATPTVTRVGYRGSKRYLRVRADFSGTHGTGTPMTVLLNKAHAEQKPVS